MQDHPKPRPMDQVVDFPLLDLAEEVLAGAGYATNRTEFGGAPAIVAENADNVVACTTALTVEDLIELESIASVGLVRLMEQPGLESKRWDAYVAVLTGQEALPEPSSRLFAANYNLRFVRRLLRSGVELDPASVEEALISVLPLRANTDSSILVPPLLRLSQLLIEHGLAPSDVERATSRFMAKSKASAPLSGDDEGAEDYE